MKLPPFLRKLFSGPVLTEKPGSRFFSESMNLSEREQALQKVKLQKNLKKNLDIIREISGGSTDLNIRKFKVGPHQVPAALVFIEGMVSNTNVASILQNLEIETLKTGTQITGKKNIYQAVRDRLLPAIDFQEVDTAEFLFDGVTSGETAVLLDGTARAIMADTRGWEARNVSEPDTETTIRGPRDGFVENLHTNTALLRRRIRSSHLRVESLEIGKLTKTRVCFMYIKGLTAEKMLEEVRSRLKKIETAGILESGYLEEFIDDSPFTLFPTVLRTERPDRVAASLLEGRVAIITDNTPFVLLVPCELPMLLQSPDDYNEKFPIGGFIRILRYLSFTVSIFLPGTYVAVLNFHPELMPTDLLLRIQATREGVPFPLIVELLLMEAAFEVLREAGIRLPRAIGPAISIVGALILGEAAIRAGIVSPGVVIIVALTAISSFTAPAFSLSISARLMRFIITILGAVMGLFGIQLGFLMMLIHAASLRSFGIPCLTPFAPFIWQDMKDAVLRWYWWGQTKRPLLIGRREPVRMPAGQMPRPGRKAAGKKGVDKK